MSFSDYVYDKENNPLWLAAKKYCKPNHFMCFEEARWTSESETSAIPKGIAAFSIEGTIQNWNKVNGKYIFDLVSENIQNRLFILKSVSEDIQQYTEKNLVEDIEKLRELFDYTPNEKLMESYRKTNNVKALYEEEYKYELTVERSMMRSHSPQDKILSLTKWLANGAKKPGDVLGGNAPRRWSAYLMKLGYDAIVLEGTALFLTTSAFEVIDEIHN